jgi:hypothetical protein
LAAWLDFAMSYLQMRMNVPQITAGLFRSAWAVSASRAFRIAR